MFSSEAWLANPSSGFYNGVATQSLRLDDGSGAYLSRTPSDTGNRRKFTWSGWFKRGNITTGVNQIFLSAGTTSVNSTIFYIDGSNDNLRWYHLTNSGSQVGKSYSGKLRDTSAWYHIMFAVDTEVADSSDTYADSNRVRVYLNGTELREQDANFGVIAQNSDLLHVNTAVLHQIGKYANLTNYTDGYLAEVNFVNDAQLTPSSFGETKNGVWIPITPNVTYGATGFRLQFTSTAHDAPASENSADTDNIGADSSGQNNHWTASDSIDTEDCAMPDSPENNFATLNPLYYLTASTHLSEGNLQLTHETTAHRANAGTMFSKTGKWYFEVRNKTDTAGSSVALGVGLQDTSKNLAYSTGDNNYIYYCNNNSPLTSLNTTTNSLGSFVAGAGDIMQVAYDADSGKLFIGKNNTYVAADSGTDGNPATGANPTATLSTTIDYIPFVGTYNNEATANFGQDDTFAGAISSAGNTDGNGRGVFKYAPPSGFLALCSANLEEPTIGPNSLTQAVNHFGTLTYTANGNASRSIVSGASGIGGEIDFKPDWLWVKSRSATYYHGTWDSSRTNKSALYPNAQDAEDTSTAGTIGSLDTNGFTTPNVSGGGFINIGSTTYVAWNWKANGGTTSTNDDGSIQSTVQVNAAAGFSIVTFTGNNTNDATIGHGLGTTPAMIITKNRADSVHWRVWHKDLQSTYTFFLSSDLYSFAPSAHSNGYIKTVGDTTYSTYQANVDSNGVNGASDAMVAYCFAEVEGYSKIGSYTSNNSGTDNAFVYLGFRPAFVLVKTKSTQQEWALIDSVRDPNNDGESLVLYPHANYDESDDGSNKVDLLSNGFKIRATASFGYGTQVYIYMAFSEVPFKYALAR